MSTHHGETIDHCTTDYTVSDDAMRWAPDADPDDPHWTWIYPEEDTT